MENLNSRINKQGVITDANGSTSVMVIKGRCTLVMGLNQTSLGPMKGYKPAQGLISLFSRTGTGRHNRNQTPLVATSTNRSTAHCRSYVEVLRSRMDRSGKYGNGSGNGVRGSGANGFRGQG
jgi:hypothetical protein